MPSFINRAPIDNAGKLMVTTTTPTADWPSLGGMTYKPGTDELAVIDAVPAANDPWNGGLRFTNLGALYVTTTLPSPVYYIGGLPVSSDGRMFMSSGAPAGTVPGGWPIAGDGGVAGVGLSPQPIFFAPLQTTLVPTTAGNPAFTFTRATTAYVADNEGILRQSIANEARFQGARRVRNLITTSSEVPITTGSVTITAGQTDPVGGSSAYRAVFAATGLGNRVTYTSSAPISSGTTGQVSIWLKGAVGGEVMQLSDGWTNSSTITITNAWARYSYTVTNSSPSMAVMIFAGAGTPTVFCAFAQSEVTSAQSNQAPSEYVSVGVLAAPYHGNAVDGVKYFATTNGNSVASNVVTEAAGVPIAPATLLGYVAENAATNLANYSQDLSGVGWTIQGATVVLNNATAPDGTLTADTVTITTNTGNNTARNVDVTNGTAYIYSQYIRGSLGQQIYLHIENGLPADDQILVTFTGTWQRVSMPFTASTTVVQASTEIYGRAGRPHLSNVVYSLWGAQVEQAYDPSSYIPTTTTAVTRNNDDLGYQVISNFDGATGTSYTETYPFAGTFTSPRWILKKSVGGFVPQYYEGNGTLAVYSGALSTSANTPSAGVINKNSTAWSGATVSICLNGGVVALGAYNSLANSGLISLSGTGSNGLRGSIRNVKFYATRLTDVELQAMTAP